MDTTTFELFRNAFSLFREGLAAVRDVKALLPAAQQEAAGGALDLAGNAASLAEAQMADALGYQLHKCTFPPQIMLAVATAYGEEQRCPACGHTTEFHKPLPRPTRAEMDYDPFKS